METLSLPSRADSDGDAPCAYVADHGGRVQQGAAERGSARGPDGGQSVPGAG